MGYVIGIDGGATKTRCAAFDHEMRLLAEMFGKSSNLTSLSQEEVQRNLKDLLDLFFLKSGLPPQGCVCICLGSAGAGRASAREVLEGILQRILPHSFVLVTDDAISALTGGTGGGPGILLISGTGSICLGRDSRGQVCRAGGWGHVMGDEGSGYDIACRMLRAIVCAHDGREAPTLLTEMVFDHWGVRDVDQLTDLVYRSGKGKSEIASIAFLCDLGYDREDKAARRIVEECAQELAAMAQAVARRLALPGEGMPCLGAGSVLEKSACLQERLQARLDAGGMGLRLADCRHDAAWGCARLAWDQVEGTK
ncbi:BadF/BadG/BcrA/BcrD ATPase family protein [Acutalibacter caecimuris]|uniref:BadF/BadG/BcrA/BcrD ATPase family protein n=1 Tax=Acutalibacter caecimuris TaxID=3093657 RepID=UPI002AC89C76|nr:BadF/BadG/BcrA/BcrD ATPase family protein [Acutalibacter sp. M00118]